MCGISYNIPHIESEDEMNKEIVVLRRTQFISCKPNYVVEKTAKTLDEAAKYKVALELLNDDKAITYVLFNEVGQFDVDTIQKVESEVRI